MAKTNGYNKRKRRNFMENQTLNLAEDILEKYSGTLADLTKIHAKLADNHDIKQYFDDQYKIITASFDHLQDYLREINMRKFTDNLM
jgi:hypothetical protein